jgi:hypothetical protein
MALSQRRQNNTFAGARLHYGTREADLEAHDSLPGEIRRALDENATKLSAETVMAFGNQLMQHGLQPDAALRRTIAKIQELEAGEISVFAGRYLADHKHPLPHAAAKVTVQRYGASGPARHRPRRMPRIRGFGLLNMPEDAA